MEFKSSGKINHSTDLCIELFLKPLNIEKIDNLMPKTSFIQKDFSCCKNQCFYLTSRRLVPMKVHEASSLYSEEKAKILRSVGTKIEEHDQQLDTYLASLKLQHLSLWDPDAQNSESELLPLPDELAERCAALNARPNAIEDLVDIMGKLSDTYRDVEAMLKEIDGLLNEEEQR